jgi:hypothetical protein
MTRNSLPLPVYTSHGEVAAFLVYPYLYSANGEWIGIVKSNRDVYSVLGVYAGKLTNPFRIIRNRSGEFNHPRITQPTPPGRIFPPATVPLAPMMPELRYDVIDVLLEEPERLHPIDTGDLREDIQ